jgi:hypothetical protein
MKYSDSISSIFVISVVTLVLLIIGVFILNLLRFPEWCVIIPYCLVLLNSIFKTKNWHVVFGLLLVLVYGFVLFWVVTNDFAQI